LQVPVATVRPRPRFAARQAAVPAEQVSQQYDIVELAYLRQVHRPCGVMRVHTGPGEPWRRRRADEVRGHGQGQFVHEPVREELVSQPCPALDQQAVHAAAVQVGEDRAEPHGRRDGDDRGNIVQHVLEPGRLGGSAVDNGTGATGGVEEPG
jgi:hypothetical protein